MWANFRRVSLGGKTLRVFRMSLVPLVCVAPCICVCVTWAPLGSRLMTFSVGSPAKMAKRIDPLKVWLGGLKVTVGRKDVMDFFGKSGLVPEDVLIQPRKHGATRSCAFVVFWTEDDAKSGHLAASGSMDEQLAAEYGGAILAHRGGHHMGVFFQLLAKLFSVVSKIILDL